MSSTYHLVDPIVISAVAQLGNRFLVRIGKSSLRMRPPIFMKLLLSPHIMDLFHGFGDESTIA